MEEVAAPESPNTARFSRKRLSKEGSETEMPESRYPSTDGAVVPRPRALGHEGPETSTSDQRVFLCVNREDILALMAGLVIPMQPIAGCTGLPVDDGRLALVSGGLRRTEAELLAAGRPQRFPILVELGQPDGRARGVLTLSRLRAFRFRSQKELEDFRFRPVAEFDTADVDCTVEAELFDQDGPARFSVGGEDPGATTRFQTADRVGGGVANMLDLALACPDIAEAVVGLLVGPAEDELSGLVGRAVRSLGSGEPAGLDRRMDIVVHAFAEAGGASGRHIVETVATGLGIDDGGAAGDEGDSRWLRYAQALFDNRRDLDPRSFQDIPPLALRAALLAALATDLDALLGLRSSFPGIGKRVLVLSAFLQGLRQGVSGLAWCRKAPRRFLLSELTAELASVPYDQDDLDLGFTMRHEGHPPTLLTEWRGEPVLSGPAKGALVSPPPTGALGDEAPIPAKVGSRKPRAPSKGKSPSIATAAGSGPGEQPRAVAEPSAAIASTSGAAPVAGGLAPAAPPEAPAASGSPSAGFGSGLPESGAPAVLDLPDGAGGTIPVMAGRKDMAGGTLLCLKRKRDFGAKKPSTADLAELNSLPGAVWRVALDGKATVLLAECILPCPDTTAHVLAERLKEAEGRILEVLSRKRPAKP